MRRETLIEALNHLGRHRQRGQFGAYSFSIARVFLSLTRHLSKSGGDWVVPELSQWLGLTWPLGIGNLLLRVMWTLVELSSPDVTLRD